MQAIRQTELHIPSVLEAEAHVLAETRAVTRLYMDKVSRAMRDQSNSAKFARGARFEFRDHAIPSVSSATSSSPG